MIDLIEDYGVSLILLIVLIMSMWLMGITIYKYYTEKTAPITNHEITTINMKLDSLIILIKENKNE